MFKNFFKKLNTGLLLINIFFLQSYLIRFSIFSIPTNLQEVLIGLQALFFLLSTLANGQFEQTIRNIRKHWIINMFVLLTAISILTVSIQDNIYFIRHLRFLLFAVILSFIFVETFISEKEKSKALTIMGIGAVTFGFFSIIYNLLGINVAPDHRLLGPLDAAVYLAYYLTPFFVYFTIQFFENRKNKLFFALSILSLLIIIATRSAGAISGSCLALILYFLLKSRFAILKPRLNKVIFIAAIFLVFGITFYTKVLPAIQTNYSSLNERGEIWQTSIHALKKPINVIWGLGYGQFQNYYATHVESVIGKKPLDFYVLQPHNLFMLFIFQYGILGLLFVFAIIIRTTRNLKTIIFNYEKLDLKIIINFIILYFLLHGMIDTPLFKNDMLFLLILFLEIGLSRDYLKPDTKSIKTA